METNEIAWRLGIALGIGLLIGLERERRKGWGPGRGSAGVRTFALAGLLGGLVMVSDNTALVVAGAIFVAALTVVSYAMSARTDPGLTSEVALMTTFVLGALAQHEPALAAGFGVVVAILLAARESLHRLVRDLMSEQELSDLLLFTAAVLVVFPLLPNDSLGPWGGLNPHKVWRLVVLVMAVGGSGYLALRLLGPRFGLPVTGLAGGFVSSSATIASMGALSKRQPELRSAAVAGAVLSNMATIIQLGIVLAATSPALLRESAPALAIAGGVAALFGAVSMWRLRGRIDGSEPLPPRRAFDLRGALIFAALISLVAFAASGIEEWLGARATLATAGVAGFADAHAAAAAAGSLAGSGKLELDDGVLAVLLGLTTNTGTKLVAAFSTGGRRFALPLLAGLAAILVGAWAGGIAVLSGAL